jgi:hypothetical protein
MKLSIARDASRELHFPKARATFAHRRYGSRVFSEEKYSQRTCGDQETTRMGLITQNESIDRFLVALKYT